MDFQEKIIEYAFLQIPLTLFILLILYLGFELLDRRLIKPAEKRNEEINKNLAESNKQNAEKFANALEALICTVERINDNIYSIRNEHIPNFHADHIWKKEKITIIKNDIEEIKKNTDRSLESINTILKNQEIILERVNHENK